LKIPPTNLNLYLVAVFIVVALAGQSQNQHLLSAWNSTSNNTDDMAMASIGIAPMSGKYGKDSSGKVRRKW